MSAPTSRGTKYRETLLVIMAFVAALVIAEIAVRIVVWLGDRQPLLIRDESTGWALKPGLTGVQTYRNGQFFISTNAHGQRLTAPVDSPAPNDSSTIVLVGDSFAQGLGVGDEEHIGWLLSQEASREVVNLGVLGFDTGQQLTALENYVQHHPEKTFGDIVVLVFENDFIEIQRRYAPFIGRSKPYNHVVDGTLRREQYQSDIRDVLMDNSRLYWLVNSEIAKLFPPPPGEANPGIEVVIHCLSAMRSLAISLGANFTVMAYRYPNAGRLLDETHWENFIRDSGAVDITPQFLDTGISSLVGFDGLHWNKSGHRLAASMTTSLINSRVREAG